MSLHVASERVDVAEAPATLAAAVRPLLRVVLHVVFERRAEREALAADGAGVGLLSGVRPHVDLHVRAVGEAFEAEVAAVGPLSGVRPGVADHGRGDVEALPAHAAAVRLLARVRPHVDRHVALAAEALPADSAAEGLLARVAARVHRQVDVPPEGFAAELADVDFDVRLQVLQQVLSVGQQSAAHAAEAVLVVGVDLCVVHQRAAVAEHHAANFTATGSAAAVFALGGSRKEVCWGVELWGRSIRQLTGSARQDVVSQLSLLRGRRVHLRLLALILQAVDEAFGVLLRRRLRSLSLDLRTAPHLLLLLLLLLLDGGRLRLLLVRLRLEIEAEEPLSVCRGRVWFSKTADWYRSSYPGPGFI